MSKPFTFAYGSKQGRCRPGSLIRTLPALVRYMESQPSVWWSTSGKPMPCAVLQNWQMVRVLAALRSRSLRRVLRPKELTNG